MRYFIRPNEGDAYTRFTFLLFPKILQGEFRWLEFAAIWRVYYQGRWVDKQWS